jgi:hypothetical protein
MRYLVQANYPHIDTLVFSSGTVLTVPELPEEPDEDAPYWRSDDDEETEEDADE